MSLGNISSYVARKKMLSVAKESEISKMGRNYYSSLDVFFARCYKMATRITSMIRYAYSLCCKTYDKVYVINLDRTPERYENVRSQLLANGIADTRFSAVDGYLVRLTVQSTGQIISGKEALSNLWNSIWDARPLLLHVDYNGTYKTAEFDQSVKDRKISAGEIGVTFSHRAIWSETAKNNYKNVVVFEDDVILSEDFRANLAELTKNIPEDADITFISVGRRRDKVCDYPNIDNIFRDFDHVKGNDVVAKIQPTNLLFGTWAYIVSAKGAKKLLELTERCESSVDDIIFQRGGVNKGTIKAYIAKKKMCVPVPETSEIKKMGRPF
jgi:glycosyl transferase family 25